MDELLVWDGGYPRRQIPRKSRYVKSNIPINQALYLTDLVPQQDFNLVRPCNIESPASDKKRFVIGGSV
jgi:hypothetical protein